jgi:hypothetical protein
LYSINELGTFSSNNQTYSTCYWYDLTKTVYSLKFGVNGDVIVATLVSAKIGDDKKIVGQVSYSQLILDEKVNKPSHDIVRGLFTKQILATTKN